jgi:LysR family transcriptional regulator, low CO2-responsive transcriptional regulator
MHPDAIDQQEYWNLRVFCAVAQHQSVSLAARELLMSQSGVSMVIHRLRQQYGTELVMKRGRGIMLTAAGAEVYRHALDTLRSADELEEKIRSLKTQDGGLISIAAQPAISTYFLPPILTQFAHAHRGVQIRVVDILPRLVILPEVLNSGVEFAVLVRGGRIVIGPDIVVEPFHQERLVIVAAADHPLARQQAPSLADIAREPFIVNSPSSQISRLENLFRSAGVGKLRIAMEVNSDGAKDLVRAGVGLSLMLHCRVKQEIARGEIHVVAVPGAPLYTEFVLVHRVSHQFSPLVAELLSAVREFGDTPALSSDGASDGDDSLTA